jgi:transcriptional regulator with XRE-family HTH domain
MSTLGERLRLAREKKGLKQTQVKERTNINNKTLSGYENNVSEPDSNTLATLADLYEVSYRWLLTGKGDMSAKKELSTTYNASLTAKDEKDIAKRMEKIKKDLTADGGLSFYGEPLSEEAKESLLEAMEYAVKQAQRLNKKYIPKKYRKDND